MFFRCDVINGSVQKCYKTSFVTHVKWIPHLKGATPKELMDEYEAPIPPSCLTPFLTHKHRIQDRCADLNSLGLNSFFILFSVGKQRQSETDHPHFVTWRLKDFSLCLSLSSRKFMSLHVFSSAGVFGSVAWHERTEEPFTGFI